MLEFRWNNSNWNELIEGLFLVVDLQISDISCSDVWIVWLRECDVIWRHFKERQHIPIGGISFSGIRLFNSMALRLGVCTATASSTLLALLRSCYHSYSVISIDLFESSWCLIAHPLCSKRGSPTACNSIPFNWINSI